MKILGICAILCLTIFYAVDVCDAECDDYIVVLEEITCPVNKIYKIKPLKIPEINWDNVAFPCNSTDKTSGKINCVVEFDCVNTEIFCKDLNKPVSFQTHTLITENHTAKPNKSKTEVLDLPNNNITVKGKPQVTVDEEYNKSILEVNLIFINENNIDNSSETINKKPRNQTLHCDYAETVCTDKGKYEDGVISVTNYSDHTKPAETLEIEINRDETSTVQPIFTGYFPESSSERSKNYNNHFNNFKTMIMPCPILIDNNCNLYNKNKSLKQINIYIKAMYIENNTITKYPNCTKDSISPENVLNVKCEDISFAIHNEHILQTPSTPPTKQELSTWNCQIKEFNYTSSSKDLRSENKKLHFINCSNETEISNNKMKSGANNVASVSDIKMNETEILSGKTELNKDPENNITILVSENANNCSNNISLNIGEGKIIDLGVNNNKEKILQNNNVELKLSSCINVNSYNIVNETLPDSRVELTIILKSESLDASNLKQFNGTPKDESVKQRVLLRCDRHNLAYSTTSNKTTLQCESIDLDLYNITGIEITPSQTSNNRTAINSGNKTKLELLTWDCQISELNDKFTKQKSKIYFENCSNDVSIINSKNKSGDNNVDSIKTKNGVKINKTNISSGELELNEDNLSHTNPENMIKILVTEKAKNCSKNSYLNIDEGKIIDLDRNNNKEEILQNNIVELALCNCINVNSYTINDTQPNLKVELTILLKNESINTSNLQQFNGNAEDESDKQRILLRCDLSNLDSSSNTTSNKTQLQCESIDLELNNITGIEISTNISQISNTNNTEELQKENLNMVVNNENQTEVYVEINKNSKFSTRRTVGKNESTVNNKSNENKLKVFESNKNNTKVVNIGKKDISENNGKFKSLNFNRKKDIPNGAGQSDLALGSPETEKTLLITLLTITGAAILLVIALRAWPKKKAYNPAPTREPPDEEETAF